jgi:hypothetical protein
VKNGKGTGLIPTDRKRRRSGKPALSEMLFIMVLFHLEAFKNFKTFYLYGICLKHRSCFNELPHYDRLVAPMPRLFMGPEHTKHRLTCPP